jgi:hypothetical protein
MAQIDAFFKLMHDQGASDLHLISGQQPVLRVGGELERVKFKLLENDGLKSMLYLKRQGMWILPTRSRGWPGIGPISSNKNMVLVLFSGKYLPRL